MISQKLDSLDDLNQYVVTRKPDTFEPPHKQKVHYIDMESLLGMTLDNTDVVLNLSNSYYRRPNSSESQVMRSSIIGVANSLAKLVDRFGTRLINFSSYFQNLSDASQSGAKEYTLFKSEAAYILETACQSSKSVLDDLCLYDNYGGSRRSTIFYLMLDSFLTKKDLSISFPLQKINLLHCRDIANAIAKLIEAPTYPYTTKRISKYDISSTVDYSLLELSHMISQFADFDSRITYSANVYRFELPHAHPRLPFLQEGVVLQNYIEEYFRFSRN